VSNLVERISTGIPEVDKMLAGGIPKGFLVAVVGEPGCGKTIFCLHFINEGIKREEKNIFVTTEESRESIVKQAMQFGFDFSGAVEKRMLVIIDALMRPAEDEFALASLDVEELVKKVIEVKRSMGYGHARLVVDSLSAFWLDKPAMARRYSYFVKKVLSKWGFTTLVTSQYAITTSEAFGFGIEHVADGIIRFRKAVRGGILRRYMIIEKMRQTPHDRRMYEVDIVDGLGLVVKRPTMFRKEDISLPESVVRRIRESKKEREEELP